MSGPVGLRLNPVFGNRLFALYHRTETPTGGLLTEMAGGGLPSQYCYKVWVALSAAGTGLMSKAIWSLTATQPMAGSVVNVNTTLA